MSPLPAAVPEQVQDATPGLRVPGLRQVLPAELPEPGLTAELPEQVQRAEPQASESQAEPRERLSEPVPLQPVKPELLQFAEPDLLLPAGQESLRVQPPVQTEPPLQTQLRRYRLPLLLRLHRRHSMQKMPHL